MSHEQPARPRLLGLGLDGHGMGPESEDGMTRLTQGEDYVLLGGSEDMHRTMQDFAEDLLAACQSEGTTLGDAPGELLSEILADFAADDEPPLPRR